MPAMAPLTLTSKTFSPAGQKSGQAIFIDRSASVPSHSSRLEIEVVEPKNVAAAQRVITRITQPKTGTVGGVTVVTHSNRVNIEMNFSQQSSAAERISDLTDLVELLQTAAFEEAVENLEMFY